VKDVAVLRSLVGVKFKSLRRLLKERDRRYEDRFKGQEQALSLLAQQTKADKAQANEWRGALADKDSRFVTREAFSAVLDRVTALETYRTSEVSESKGTAKFFGWIVAGASLLVVLVTLYSKLG
jgi:hypothetical protein